MISLLLFGLIPQTEQAGAQLPDDDDVWIEFYPGESKQVASVAPWENNGVSFPVLIDTVINPWDEHIYNITLTASTDKNWEVEISPSFVLVQPGEKDSASVTVFIPHGTSREETGEVTVGGTARTEPGNALVNIDEIIGEITIEQYFDFNVEPLTRNLTVSADGIVTYTLKVTNNGNGNDKYQFEIANKDELADEGIYVHFKPTELTVPQKTSKTFNMVVSTSEDTGSERYDIKLRVKSPFQQQAQGTGYYEEVDLNIDVRGLGILDNSLVPGVIILAILISIIAVIVKKRRG